MDIARYVKAQGQNCRLLSDWLMEVGQKCAQMWAKKEHDDDMMNMTESQWVRSVPTHLSPEFYTSQRAINTPNTSPLHLCWHNNGHLCQRLEERVTKL